MPDPLPKTEFATKQDLAELELRLMKQMGDLRQEVGLIRSDLLKEFGTLKGDLFKQFGDFKTAFIMWHVGLMVAMFAALKFIP